MDLFKESLVNRQNLAILLHLKVFEVFFAGSVIIIKGKTYLSLRLDLPKPNKSYYI